MVPDRKKDKAKFIPIHTLQSSLGPLLSKALPAYHVLTGCDTASFFSGIGKKKSWKVLVNDSEAQQQLASLGEEPLAQESQLQSCEVFVCSLYTTAKKFAITDDARHFLFCQKNTTSDNLPPTSDCLSHRIKEPTSRHTHISGIQHFVQCRTFLRRTDLGGNWKMMYYSQCL